MQPNTIRACAGLLCVSIFALLMSGSRPSADDEGIVLKDGQAGSMQMPRIGFGTCCRSSANGPPLIKSTLAYLAEGGRLIDTAQMYKNHKALAQAIAQSGINREELWITSKIMTIAGGLGRAATFRQVNRSVRGELDLEWVDLMLLHHAKGNSRDERVAQWQGLLDARAAGLVKNVGVSNYNQQQIQELHAATGYAEWGRTAATIPNVCHR